MAMFRKFQCSLRVLPGETTVQSVEDWFGQAATDAESGDLVVFTFAGHAVQVRDQNGDEGEFDQAIVCSDLAIRDDTIHGWLAKFKKNVRVVLVAESCFSGSIYSTLIFAAGSRIAPKMVWSGLVDKPKPVDADVLLLAAAKENTSAPGAGPGERLPPYTQKLVEAWDRYNGDVPGGYDGWNQAAKGVLATDMLHDYDIVKQYPFKI